MTRSWGNKLVLRWDKGTAHLKTRGRPVVQDARRGDWSKTVEDGTYPANGKGRAKGIEKEGRKGQIRSLSGTDTWSVLW